MYAMGPGFWSGTVVAVSAIVNTFAEWCVLLLRGDGTEASTTFTDESLVARTMTAVGNSNIDTARFRFGTGAMEFDGTGDYLTAPDSTDWDFPSSVTIEFWLYITALDTNGSFILSQQSGATYGGFEIYVGNTGIVQWNKNDTTSAAGSSSGQITTGVWYHLAFVWTGAVYKIYKDGVEIATATSGVGPTDVAGVLRIGSYVANANYDLNGYIDNLRILKGVAAYTAAFTPSARALPYPDDPYYSYVVLLLRGEGADASTVFTDESWYARAATVTADAQIDTAQFKMGTSSMLFDGALDKIAFPDSADLTLGTKDWTLEGWFRPSALPAADGQHFICGQYVTATGATSASALLAINRASGVIRWNGRAWSGATGAGNIIGTTTPVINTWYHIAYCRSGSNFYLFVDGVQEGTVVSTLAMNDSAGTFSLGQIGDYTTDFYNGWIDNFRFTVGIARYTAAFTPPVYGLPIQGPPEPDPYYHLVKLQLNCNGTDASTTFTDTSPVGRTVTALGNAQIDTAQSRFGGASALFDGAGDYLTTPNSADFASTTFTVECWVRFNVLAALSSSLISQYQGVSNGWWIEYLNADTKINVGFSGDGADITSTTTPVINTWYHVAVSGVSGNYRLFINGVQEGSTYTGATTLTSTAALEIGRLSSVGVDYLNGWIDDVRYTAATRYTANFTPPTREFGVVQGDAFADNVVLLLKGDAPDASVIGKDSSKYNRTVTVVGNAQIDTAQSKFGGASWLFDGTGDNLYVADSNDFDLTVVNWTIEGWFRPAVLPPADGDYYLCGQYATATGVTSATAYLAISRASGVTRWTGRAISSSTGVGTILGTTTPVINTWYHIAYVRSGSNFYLFVDGVQEGTVSSAASLNSSAGQFSVGQLGDYNGGYYNGWIDDLRFTVGTARYTAAFTPLTKTFPEY